MRRLLIALLFVPPAFELTARLDDRIRHGVPLSSGATGIADLRVTDSLGEHARASTVYRRYRINALGFRGQEVSTDDLQHRPVVVVSGSSESFGLYESERHEWPAQLADSLAAQCESAPVVLNAAFAGMVLPTVTQDLARRVLPLHPDVVVYYPQPSQYLFEYVPWPAPGSAEAPAPLSPWRLRGLPRLRDDVKRAIPEEWLDRLRIAETERMRREGVVPFDALPVERLDSIEAHLRTLVGTVRRGGSAAVLVLPQHRFSDTTSVEDQRWLRAWERVAPKASGAMILEFSRLADARIRLVAADSGVGLVEPPFPQGPARAALFVDASHFTDSGAGLLAGSASAVVARTLGCRQ